MFDLFPILVIDKIFKYLDHASLVAFANAFPIYRTKVIESVHWKYIDFYIESKFILGDELVELVSYLNYDLYELKVAMGDYNLNVIEKIFQTIPNLRRLATMHINDHQSIYKICSYLMKLEVLEIDYPFLESEQVIHIADNLANLKKIKFSFSDNLSTGFMYLFKKISNLIACEIQSQYKLKEEALLILLEKHCDTLEELTFDNLDLTDAVIPALSRCTKLTKLKFCNKFLFNNNECDFNKALDQMNKLKLIKLEYRNFQAFINFQPIVKLNLFYNPKINLVYCYLANFLLTDTQFESMAEW